MNEKTTIIKLLHKILFVKEDAQNPNIKNIGENELHQCIENMIVRFQGADILQEDLRKEIVESLNGLKIGNVNYTTFRSIILGLMNKVDRLLL